VYFFLVVGKPYSKIRLSDRDEFPRFENAMKKIKDQGRIVRPEQSRGGGCFKESTDAIAPQGRNETAGEHESTLIQNHREYHFPCLKKGNIQQIRAFLLTGLKLLSSSLR
jgi:hypothetical protein